MESVPTQGTVNKVSANTEAVEPIHSPIADGQDGPQEEKAVENAETRSEKQVEGSNTTQPESGESNALPDETAPYVDGSPQESNDFTKYCGESARLFHTPEGQAFATVMFNGHWENLPIRSRGFGLYLARRVHKKEGEYPAQSALNKLLHQFEGMAIHGAPEKEIHVRVAYKNKGFYIDRCDPNREIIEVSKNGVRIIADDKCPVRFSRSNGAMPLPRPKSGGSLNLLKNVLWPCTIETFISIVAWLLGAFMPHIPVPILAIFGEQGSGKSTLSRILGKLTDPTVVQDQTFPRSEREFGIIAALKRAIGFDNQSILSDKQSDWLSRMVTGAGVEVRTTFMNRSLTRFNNRKAIHFNGISNIISRNDLAERTIIVTLEQIKDENRRPEMEIWATFERIAPLILNAICDALSMALRNIDRVELPSLPRMADFVQWVVAAEPALPWEKGRFLEVYNANMMQRVDLALEEDLLGSVVLKFMEKRTKPHTRTATELLEDLSKPKYISPSLMRLKAWPKRPNALSKNLARLQTFLRHKGILVERQHSGSRSITLFNTRLTPDRAGKSDTRSEAESDLELLDADEITGPPEEDNAPVKITEIKVEDSIGATKTPKSKPQKMVGGGADV